MRYLDINYEAEISGDSLLWGRNREQAESIKQQLMERFDVVYAAKGIEAHTAFENSLKVTDSGLTASLIETRNLARDYADMSFNLAVALEAKRKLEEPQEPVDLELFEALKNYKGIYLPEKNSGVFLLYSCQNFISALINATSEAISNLRANSTKTISGIAGSLYFRNKLENKNASEVQPIAEAAKNIPNKK